MTAEDRSGVRHLLPLSDQDVEVLDVVLQAVLEEDEAWSDVWRFRLENICRFLSRIRNQSTGDSR